MIFSKKTIDFKLNENIVIKSSPDVLCFTISMFKSDGLNCVAALIKNNNEARNMVIVTIKDPLNIPIIPPINKKADAIIDIIAPNFRMALLLKVVLFESIRSEHAS